MAGPVAGPAGQPAGPPAASGDSSGGQPALIDFGEPSRCAAAKAQLEQACAAVRAEQTKRLSDMLNIDHPG